MPNPLPKQDKSGTIDDTRERIIRAAAEEFASLGFAKGRVRAICSAAEANVSAVKYHFGGKEKLYREVWEMAAKQMITAEPMPHLDEYDEPAEALSEFIAWFLRLVLLETEAHPVAGCLMAHETVEPTGALDLFVKFCAGPIHTELEHLVRGVVGPKPSKRVVADLSNSVVALCVTPKHSHEILTRLGSPPPTSKASINRMAKTLARFALSGLEGFKEEGVD